jgi:hypothetical protein
MPPAVPPLGWGRQLQALEPYFAGHGGVVRVQVTDGSPASNFSKVIRQLMDGGQWARPWRCVQIDALNSSTHYFEDVVAHLGRSFELGPATASLVAGGAAQAGADVTADSVEVPHREDDHERVHRSRERPDRVADAIEERLMTERIALLFFNSHTYHPNVLSLFRRQLWDTRLQALAGSGLLLIDISDPTPGCGPDWPPEADLLLDLPERFDDASRLDAHADLVRLALAEGIAANADEAEVAATTLLDASDTIRDVYAGFARMLASRPEST